MLAYLLLLDLLLRQADGLPHLRNMIGLVVGVAADWLSLASAGRPVGGPDPRQGRSVQERRPEPGDCDLPGILDALMKLLLDRGLPLQGFGILHRGRILSLLRSRLIVVQERRPCPRAGAAERRRSSSGFSGAARILAAAVVRLCLLKFGLLRLCGVASAEVIDSRGELGIDVGLRESASGLACFPEHVGGMLGGNMSLPGACLVQSLGSPQVLSTVSPRSALV